MVGGIYSRFRASSKSLRPVAVDLGSGWSVGFVPTLDVADLQLSPASFATPNFVQRISQLPQCLSIAAALRPGVPDRRGLPNGRGPRPGVLVQKPAMVRKVHLDVDGWDRPAAPTWRMSLDYPMILSSGVAYSGIDKLVLLLDAKWINFASAAGFGGDGHFNPDGSVSSLGWHSVWSFGTVRSTKQPRSCPCGSGTATTRIRSPLN